MTMRIGTGQRIGCVRAMEARAFVRVALAWERFTADGAADRLNRPVAAVRRIIRALAADGYLERAPAGSLVNLGAPSGRVWEVSTQGAALARATAAAPIRRETADALLAAVVARAHTLRDWSLHPYAFGVRRLLVFGSYLGDASALGDLDVSVAWMPRFADREAQHVYRRERTRMARQAGRTFSNISNEYGWPLLEAARFLRGRRRGVSLHAYDDEPEFIAGILHRVLIDEPSAPA